ncbi:hypothetical protein LQW54_009305 [Pestalotiopsis sp. IQ-011]
MVEQMTSEEIQHRVLGSKWLFTGWNTYVALIWTLKGCMLFFFNRITTDFMIVAIPIPLLFAVKLTVARKLAIGALLCSGVFVMIATLLRCVLSLQNVELINLCTIWAIRETFVAIIAVNAAPIKPLFSSVRWLKSTSKGGTDSHTPYDKRSNTYALSGRSKSKGSQLRSVLPFHTNPAGTQILSSSEEDIVKGGAGTRSHISQSSTAHSIDMDNAQRINDGGIVVTTTYQVKDDGSHMQSQESDGKW